MSHSSDDSGTIDPFAGCLLGLATGDALGAPYEGGVLERLLWRTIGHTREGAIRWTDDTQMAIDLAESLLENNGVNPEALVQRFAKSYRWSRGYGPGMAKVLKRVRNGVGWEAAAKSVYPEGSFGNGAAMRSPVLALFYGSDDPALLNATRSSSRTTHAHPLGIEGAVLIATATQCLLLRRDEAELFETLKERCPSREFAERLQLASSWIASGAAPPARQVVSELGNAMTAPASCVTALYVALRHLALPFEEMMAFIAACGGDVDTIGAMAGALWGVVNGEKNLPAVDLERRNEIATLASRLRMRSIVVTIADDRA